MDCIITSPKIGFDGLGQAVMGKNFVFGLYEDLYKK